jgi:hypothetical protein
MLIRIIGQKRKRRQPRSGARYRVVTAESSRIQGQAAMVSILPLLVSMTVIFMIRACKRAFLCARVGG